MLPPKMSWSHFGQYIIDTTSSVSAEQGACHLKEAISAGETYLLGFHARVLAAGGRTKRIDSAPCPKGFVIGGEEGATDHQVAARSAIQAFSHSIRSRRQKAGDGSFELLPPGVSRQRLFPVQPLRSIPRISSRPADEKLLFCPAPGQICTPSPPEAPGGSSSSTVVHQRTEGVPLLKNAAKP